MMKLRMFFVFVLALSAFCVLGGDGVVQRFGNVKAFQLYDGIKDPDTKLEALKDGGGEYVRLSGISKAPTRPGGNYYISCYATLDEPLDLEGKALVLEAKTTHPVNKIFFEIHLCDKNSRQRVWTFLPRGTTLTGDWKEYHLQCETPTVTHQWMKAPDPKLKANNINRLFVKIGSGVPGTPIDVCVRHLKLVKPWQSVFKIERTKQCIRETVLVQDGKPEAVILHPETEAGRKCADALATLISAKTGVAIPVRPGTQADAIPESTAIILGTMNDNPALSLLYARMLTPVDWVCPGDGGSLVHTVFDPFGKHRNVIVMGASDADGLAKALAAITPAINKAATKGNLILPRLFERNYSPAFLRYYAYADDPDSPDIIDQGLKRARETWKQGRHCNIAYDLQHTGAHYLLTGNHSYAKLFVKTWKLYNDYANTKPDQHGGPWGWDSDFPSIYLAAYWDSVEEDETLTEAEKLETFHIMMRFFQEKICSRCEGWATRDYVIHNHATFPALGMARIGIYLTTNYPKMMEGQRWLKHSDQLFARHSAYGKISEDCNSYQWITNSHLLKFATFRPLPLIFDNGGAKRIVDYCLLMMNNFGYQVPSGDIAAWRLISSEVYCLDVAAQFLGDRDALWATLLKRNPRRLTPQLFGYTPKPVELTPPTRFNGVLTWPVDQKYYDSYKPVGAPWNGGAPRRAAREDCVDKISFREKMDPEALYLLYDGLANGGHKHDDGNSILQFCRFSRIWLADNDYFKATLKYHNSLALLKNGESTQLPSYSQLLGTADTPEVGYSLTQVVNYSGATWQRAIVWLKPTNAIAVLDRVIALEDAEYQASLLWHGIGDAKLTEDGMLLTQKGPCMWLQINRDTCMQLTDDAALGANWAGYPHADPLVRSFNAISTRKLRNGESIQFITLFHGRADGNEPAWNIMRSNNGFFIDDGTSPVVLGFADGNGSDNEALLALHSPAGILKLGSATDKAAVTRVPAQLSPDAFRKKYPAQALTAVKSPVAAQLPSLKAACKAAWSVAPRPDSFIISGNKRLGNVLTQRPKLTCDPAPLAANIFNASSPNSVDALLDGAWNTTDASVMFPPDKTVEITLDFPAAVSLTGFNWKQWYATTSSKKAAFILEHATLQASSDGFKKDIRSLYDFTETQKHPNFGTPVEYNAVFAPANCTALRLQLKPKAGTAVYLGELITRGNVLPGQGLPDNLYPIGRISAVTTARLAKGTLHSLLVTSLDGDVFAFSQDGNLLWHRNFIAPINDIDAVDIDNDGIDEFVLAREDCKLSLHKADASIIWENEIPRYRVKPAANIVRHGDLDGDGYPEVVCGANSWRFHAYNARTGKELWNYESVHPSRSGVVDDINGDGKAEVICGTHYYWMPVLDGNGKKIWNTNFGPICHDIATGNFFRSPNKGILYASANNFFYLYSHDGKLVFSVNTGNEVLKVLAADSDGDGADDVIAGGLSRYLYCFKPDGSRAWLINLHAGIKALATLPGNGPATILAGTDDANLYQITNGNLTGRTPLSAPITHIIVINNSIFVTTTDGLVTRLNLN